MFELDPITDLLLCFTLGMGASIVGVLSFFFSRRRVRIAGWIFPLTLCLMFAVAAVGLATTGNRYLSFVPLVVLASFFGLLAGARTPIVELAARQFAGFFRRNWVAPVCLVFLGLSFTGWQIYALDQRLATEAELADKSLKQVTSFDLEPIPGCMVQTDKGRNIQLMRVPGTTDITDDDDLTFIQSFGLDLKVIQTGSGDDSYNCHGWVFAQGKAWIAGESVDGILQDNGYQTVSTPTVGDVVVFRQTDMKVSHSAIVRAVTDDGRILVESKWGRMGRYIHTLDNHAYHHHQVTYYHSQRAGHQLRTSKDEPRTIAVNKRGK